MSRTKEARGKRNPVKLTNWQTKNPKDGRSHGAHGRASLASAFWRGLRISMAVLLAMTFSVGSIPLNARANADVPEPMPVTERVDTNGVDNPVVAQEAMGDDADLGETDSDILKLEIASRDELEAVLSDDPALLASSSDTAATGKTVNLEITKNWEGDNADDRPESINVVVQHKDAQTGETITDGQVTLSPDSGGKWKGTLPDMPYEDSDHNRIDYLFQESFGPGGNNAQSDYDLSVGVTTKATMKNLELWVLAYNANGVSELVNGTSYTIGTGTTHASQVLRPEGPTQDVMSGNQYVFNPEEGDEAANANGMQYKTYTYFGVGDTTVKTRSVGLRCKTATTPGRLSATWSRWTRSSTVRHTLPIPERGCGRYRRRLMTPRSSTTTKLRVLLRPRAIFHARFTSIKRFRRMVILRITSLRSTFAIPTAHPPLHRG